ncbi:putative uncharacterized protein DDB_G0270496, partial [Cynara cardunculus var. scolymus]|uniref:putative uncharacterized protein DDB_G0270496 n=1 Tax=Cynara cardunculus var. scolymus TaxID=59895 RepID=UPI000D62B24D
MAEDVNLLPKIATVLDKMTEVHQDMPIKEDLYFDLSTVKVEVSQIKYLLSAVQADVCTNAEAISTLSDKVDEAQAQLTTHGELMQQKLNLLQRPALVSAPSFTKADTLSLDQKYLPQAATVVPTTPTYADAQDERAEANKANAEVVDAITSCEVKVVAEAEDNDDAFKDNAKDDDLLITSTANVGDKEDEDEDDDDSEADDPLSFPDAGKDLGADDDDEDYDDDDFHHSIPHQTIPSSTHQLDAQGEEEDGGEKEDGMDDEIDDDYDMASDIKLLFLAVDTVIYRITEVHKEMPRRADLDASFLAIQADRSIIYSKAEVEAPKAEAVAASVSSTTEAAPAEVVNAIPRDDAPSITTA